MLYSLVSLCPFRHHSNPKSPRRTRRLTHRQCRRPQNPPRPQDPLPSLDDVDVVAKPKLHGGFALFTGVFRLLPFNACSVLKTRMIVLYFFFFWIDANMLWQEVVPFILLVRLIANDLRFLLLLRLLVKLPAVQKLQIMLPSRDGTESMTLWPNGRGDHIGDGSLVVVVVEGRLQYVGIFCKKSNRF